MVVPLYKGIFRHLHEIARLGKAFLLMSALPQIVYGRSVFLS